MRPVTRYRAEAGIPVPARPRRVRLARLSPAARTASRARRMWHTLVAAVLTVAGCYGTVTGNHIDEVKGFALANADAAGTSLGFRIAKIEVEGQNHTGTDAIFSALAIDRTATTVVFDTAAAKARLEEIGWIKHAEVIVQLPSTVHVSITERTPYALWQNDGETRVIDAGGHVIGRGDRRSYPNLPLVVGEGADATAHALIKALAARKSLNRGVTAAVRVADRRWNIELDSGLTLWLPETGQDKAIERAARLLNSHRVSPGAVAVIDLRLADRITLRVRDRDGDGDVTPSAGLHAPPPSSSPPMPVSYGTARAT